MRRHLLILGVAAAAMAFGAGAAAAGSEVLWTNSFVSQTPGQSANSLGFAGLDGAAGGRFAPFAGAPVAGPFGVAVDPMLGRIYWSNDSGSDWSIGWSTLDGALGGRVAAVNGATVIDPHGVAIDPVDRRVYWADFGNNTLAWAGLDAPTGGQVTVPAGVAVKQPMGLAIDPVGRRLYWSNFGDAAHPISFVDLDDANGGMIGVPAGTFGQVRALAFDPPSRRLYWSNLAFLGFVNVDDPANRGTLTAPAGATISEPWGVAIDPMQRRLYWVNQSGSFAFRDLDAPAPAGGKLTIPQSAPVNQPAYLVLLLAPQPVAPPAIAGGGETGATLSCSQGVWAAESPATFPYRAPQSFAFQWSRDGTTIANATAGSLTADAAGDYRCTVTAGNGLASASQTSAAHTVAPPGTNTGTGTGTGTGGGTGTGTGTGSGTGTGIGGGTGTGTGTGGSPDRTPPVLRGVKLSPARFWVGKARTAVAAAKRKRALVRGTVLRFVSSEAGRLSLVVERVKPGIKARSHGRSVCRAVRKAVKRGRCTVSARVATLTRTIKPGSGSVAFSGRIGSKALAPGVYRLTATARDAAGNASKPARLTFTILKG
jgi:DNA-binding beta-propeller fold protein YncE